MRLAVLGFPTSHSLSPRIHTAAIRHLGLDATYEAKDVDEDGMRSCAGDARAGVLFGASITMPHKRLAARLCDVLAPSAATIGSVNTWVTGGSGLVGHSTDGAGLRFAWEEAGLPAGGPVVILGAGGAAAAAAAELAGTHDVMISSRRPQAARDLATRLGVGATAWGTPPRGAVVVNATPVGMAGEALDTGFTTGAGGFFEMVYADGATPAEVRARNDGLMVARGVDMLLGQAAASFRLWFGVDAPVDVMRAALNASSAPGHGPKPPSPRR